MHTVLVPCRGMIAVVYEMSILLCMRALTNNFFTQVGTNLVNVAIGKKMDVMLRELGGSMAPIWPMYYRDSTAIMVSSANRCPFACLCLTESVCSRL